MTGPLFITSGDLIADRRYDCARAYAADGDLAAAADLFAQAVELAPGFASAWFALGEVRESARRSSPARSRRSAGRATPTRKTATAPRLHLARLGGGRCRDRDARTPTCARCSTSTRRASTARSRDLSYSAPAHAARRHHGSTARASARMLDLGCGTGLAGAAFRPHVDWLVGVDLSPKMIEAGAREGPV